MTNEISGGRYNLVDTIIRQTDRVNSSADKTKNPDNLVNGTRSFQEILNEQFNKRVSFSKHANQRVETRNIRISESDLNRLDNACDRAQQKGIRDALIVMDNSAFIINTPNKVVITVVDKNEMKSNIFTNIDGALFI
ncbi:MAG: TIGR02530 family flagellar biosynthesis protein [Anaerovoracaceae bacterium]|jgi:flagellar operon protein|nr:flagellar biosynthesis protein [Clostridiales bacterium]